MVRLVEQLDLDPNQVSASYIRADINQNKTYFVNLLGLFGCLLLDFI